MLRFCRPIFQVFPKTKCSAKKFTNCTALLNKNSNCEMEEQVLQYVQEFINPLARVNIKSNIYTRVMSCNMQQYPDSNSFAANLIKNVPANENNNDECCKKEPEPEAEMSIFIDDDKKLVNLEISKCNDEADIFCEVHVPPRACVYINITAPVYLSHLVGKRLCVRATENIESDFLRNHNIILSSECGDIHCAHLLFGHMIQLETKGQNTIRADKLMGRKMYCKTDAGNIQIGGCYVNESKFETNTGCLELNNLHHNADVIVKKQANVDIRGVRGCLNLNTKGSGELVLHMSKVFGESNIVCDEVKQASLFISDSIAKSVDINVSSASIELCGSLSSHDKSLSSDKKKFNLSKKTDNKLIVSTKLAKVKLGIISWAESMLQKDS